MQMLMTRFCYRYVSYYINDRMSSYIKNRFFILKIHNENKHLNHSCFLQLQKDETGALWPKLNEERKKKNTKQNKTKKTKKQKQKTKTKQKQLETAPLPKARGKLGGM